MKNILSIASFLLVTFGLNAQINADDQNQTNIAKNGVQSQTSFKHKFIGGEPSAEGSKTSETTFDEKGNTLTVINYYEKNGEIKTQESYKYNASGKKIMYNKLEGGRIKFQRLYNYDGENLLKESGLNGGEKYANTYEYQNNKLSKITYTTEGVVTEIRIFTYNGNITTVTVQDASGNIRSKLKITRDSKDNVLEEQTLDFGGNQIDRITYKYNTKGMISEESKFGPDNQLYYTNFYEYNADGFVLKFFEQTGTDKKFEKKLYEYDSNNNLTVIKWRRNESDKFNEMSYTYNEKGLRTSVTTYSPAYNFKQMNKYQYTFK